MTLVAPAKFGAACFIALVVAWMGFSSVGRGKWSGLPPHLAATVRLVAWLIHSFVRWEIYRPAA